MSIRFKFRSALNFDSLEIGDRASISVRELRAEILRGKVSQPQQQGFDLLFSDAVSGLEYKGDDSHIPRGSSVVVKRIPCGTVPSALSPIEAVNNVWTKDAYTFNPAQQEPTNEFDDFSADLCPILYSNLPHSAKKTSKNDVMNNGIEDFAGLRLDCQNLDANNLNRAIPRGSNQTGNERNILLEARMEEQRKISNNLPLELKCSLCNYYLKDAVMIPCCQHSFCENCINLVLIEKGRCPKCFSGKCGAGDLLPNISLRKAIKLFLESQILDTLLEKCGMQKYVPDGESGIQAEDSSCALTVVRRDLEIPQSSCATGKGSNQVFETCPEQQTQRNVPFADYADSGAKRKEGFWFDSEGGDRNFLAPGGYRKGIRTCFICGLPDHLMKDCPSSNLNPMFQSGNEAFNGGMPTDGTPYGINSTFLPFRPYVNMYSNGGLIPFNASMVPVAPYAMPPYISSMCGGLSIPSGNSRMGNMRQPHRPVFFGLQHCENRQKHLNENLPREQLSNNEDLLPEGYRYKCSERSIDYMSPKGKKPSLSLSRESFTRRSRKRTQRDKYHDADDRHVDEKHRKSSHVSYAGRQKRRCRSRRSKSSTEDLSKSSDQPSEGRHERHYGESKYHERMGHCEWSDHSSRKGFKGRVKFDIRVSHKRHHSFSESAYDLISAVDRGRGYKERDAGHDSRHSRHSSRHLKI